MPAAAAAGVPRHPAAPGANVVKRPDGHKGLMRRKEQDQDTQRRRSEDQGRPSDQSQWTKDQWKEHYQGLLFKKLKEKDAAHKAALETAGAIAANIETPCAATHGAQFLPFLVHFPCCC